MDGYIGTRYIERSMDCLLSLRWQEMLIRVQISANLAGPIIQCTIKAIRRRPENASRSLDRSELFALDGLPAVALVSLVIFGQKNSLINSTKGPHTLLERSKSSRLWLESLSDLRRHYLDCTREKKREKR